MNCGNDIIFCLHENDKSFLDDRDFAMSKYMGALANHMKVLVQAIPKDLFKIRELAQFRYDRMERIH